jgi:hypothetical protein
MNNIGKRKHKKPNGWGGGGGDQANRLVANAALADDLCSRIILDDQAIGGGSRATNSMEGAAVMYGFSSHETIKIDFVM